MACSGITQSGTVCRATPVEGSSFCYMHDPSYAEKRRRASSRGGKSGGRGRSNAGAAYLKEELRALRARVDSGDLDPTRANTMIRCISVEVDVVRLERQVHLEDNLEREVEELQELLGAREGEGRRWG